MLTHEQALQSETLGDHFQTAQKSSGDVQVSPAQVSAISPSQDSFVRLEDKYWLPAAQAGQLLALMHQHLDVCSPVAGTEFTDVESIYFDNRNLHVYRTHFQDLPRRFKVRTRTYAPNGKRVDDARYLEMKAKENGICKKSRFQIDAESHLRLEHGAPLPCTGELRDLNAQLESKRLLKRLARVNLVVGELGLRPQMRVAYRREAFERDGFRVTLDRDIRVELLQPIPSVQAEAIVADPVGWTLADAMRAGFRAQEHLVLEVKHSGVVPEWMTEFTRCAGLEKVSFSKYCFGMTEAIAARAKGGDRIEGLGRPALRPVAGVEEQRRSS